MPDDLDQFRGTYLRSGSPMMLLGTSLSLLLRLTHVLTPLWAMVAILGFIAAGTTQHLLQRARLRKTA